MKKRTLVLPTLAMMTLIGCSDEIDRNERVRNTYASKEACLKDWNNKPEDCQFNPQYHGYVGPWYPYYMYMNGYNRGLYRGSLGMVTYSEPAVVVPRSSLGSSGTISRGGFGTSAHGFSMGE